MAVPDKPPPGVSILQNEKKEMAKHWKQWLDLLVTELRKSLVPPDGIVAAELSAAEIAANFDGNGRGNAGGEYEWWQICNGNNSSPDLTASELVATYNMTYLIRIA